MRRIIGNFKNNKKLGIGKRFVAVLLSSALLFTSFDLQVFADELNNGKSFFYCGEKYETIYDVLEEAREKGDKNIDITAYDDIVIDKEIVVNSDENISIISEIDKDNNDNDDKDKLKIRFSDEYDFSKNNTGKSYLFNIKNGAKLSIDGYKLEVNCENLTMEKNFIDNYGEFDFRNSEIRDIVPKKRNGYSFIRSYNGVFDFYGSSVYNVWNLYFIYVNHDMKATISGGKFEKFNVGGGYGSFIGGEYGKVIAKDIEVKDAHAFLGGAICAKFLYIYNSKFVDCDGSHSGGAIRTSNNAEIINCTCEDCYCSNRNTRDMAIDSMGTTDIYGITIKGDNRVGGILLQSGKLTLHKSGEYEFENFGKVKTNRNVIENAIDRGLCVENKRDDNTGIIEQADFINNKYKVNNDGKIISVGGAIENHQTLILDDVKFEGNETGRTTLYNEIECNEGDDIYNDNKLILKSNVKFCDDNVNIFLAKDRYVTVKDNLNNHFDENTKINVAVGEDVGDDFRRIVKYESNDDTNKNDDLTSTAYEMAVSKTWNIVNIADKYKKNIGSNENSIGLYSNIFEQEVKVINDKGESVSNVSFDLYKKLSEGDNSEVIDVDNKYKNYYKLANTKASDENGKILIERLTEGKYFIKVKDNAEGYDGDAESFFEVGKSENVDTITVNLGHFNEAPIANISVSDDDIKVYKKVSFSGEGSTDDEGIAKYIWRIDDKLLEGKNVTYKFSEEGSYIVSLTVTDNKGRTGSATKKIEVSSSGLDKIDVEVKSTETDGFIKNATIYITDEDNEKIADKILPLGTGTFYSTHGQKINVIAMADGYDMRSTSLVCKGEGKITLYLSTRNTIQGEIKVKELTLEEMKDAGIDVGADENKQIVKYSLNLSFVRIRKGKKEKKPYDFYVDKKTNKVVVGGFSGTTSSKDGEVEIITKSDKFGNVYLMVINGTNKWLKDMFEVELIVINTSKVEIAKDTKATIKLPDGLSLAKMATGSNETEVEMGDIDVNASKSAVWYVRGDVDGTYYVSADVTGKMHTKDTEEESEGNIAVDDHEFSYTFVSDKPLNVTMQSALGVIISLSKTAATGDTYTVGFNYYNKSTKSIYGLEFDIEGDTQVSPGQTTFQNGIMIVGNAGDAFEDRDLNLLEGEEVNDNYVEELKPGEFVRVSYATTITFLDSNKKAVITELVGWALSILEGSTASMDVSFNVTRTEKDDANYEKAYAEGVDMFSGDPVNMLTGAFEGEFEDIKISGYKDLSFKRLYNSLSEDNVGFGKGWSHNYNYQVVSTGSYNDTSLSANDFIIGDNEKVDVVFADNNPTDYIRIKYPDGKIYTFTKVTDKLDSELEYEDLSSGMYQCNDGKTLKVVRQNGKTNKVILNDKGVVYTFDKNKHLVSIEDVEGFETKLTYDGGFLSQISNEWFDIDLSWNFVSNTIESVTYTNGDEKYVNKYKYEDTYLTGCMNSNEKWEEYTYVDVKKENTEIDGENSTPKDDFESTKLLKTISDYKGNEVLKNTYDKNGRVVVQITAGKGTYSYNYNDEDRINTQTGYKSGKRIVKYNEDNQIISDVRKDDKGVSYDKTKYEYNAKGLPMIITENGEEKKIIYNEFGDISYIEYEDDTTEEYQYDTKKGFLLTKVKDRIDNVIEYSYSGNLLKKKVDGNKNEFFYFYDDSNRLIEEKHGDKIYSEISYNKDGRVKNIKEDKYVTSFTYDALGDVKTSKCGDYEYKYNYDNCRNLLSETDEKGNTFYYGLDDNGNVVSTTDRRNNTEVRKLEDSGNVEELIDRMKYKTKYVYDNFGYLSKEINDAGDNVVYKYDAYGNIVSKTDERGKTWRFEYDNQGRCIAQINPLDERTEYSYDKNGNVKSKIIYDSKNPDEKYKYSYNYDAVGRLVDEVDIYGNKKHYEYDGNGNVSLYVDEEGFTTNNKYDENNNLIYSQTADKVITYSVDSKGNIKNLTVKGIDENDHEVEVENHTRKYEYDLRGNISKFTDENGNVTKYEYDETGNLKKNIYADGTVEERDYDKNGNLVSLINRNGDEISYEYDANDRLKKITDGDKIIEYSYDFAGRIKKEKYPEGKFVSYNYDKSGNLITKTENEIVTRYERDALGRVTKESIENKAVDDKETDKESIDRYKYTYDVLGNITSVTDGRNKTEKYKYSNKARVKEVTDKNGNIIKFEYDKKGNVKSEKYNNGKVITYYYDAFNQVIKKELSNNKKITFEYKYDLYGNLKEYKDGEGHKTYYSYDACGNNTKITDALGNYTEFTYDAFGNVKSKKSSGTIDESYIYDLNNNLKELKDSNKNTTKYTYDRYSNLKSETRYDGKEKRTFEYEYDLLDRCKSIIRPDGSTESFDYNYNDKITKKTDGNGNVTNYSYDFRGNLLNVTDAEKGSVSYQYDKENNLTKIIKDKDIFIGYEYDANGNRSKVTDELGNETEYSYDEFGNVLSEVNPKGRIDYSYDLNDCLTKKIVETKKSKKTTKYTFDYDNNGNLIELYNGANKTNIQRDSMGNVISVSEGNTKVSYEYDKDYRKAEINNGTQAKYEYYNNGNVKSVKTSENEWSFDYNGYDELIEKTSKGIKEKFEYDKLGRLLKTYSNNKLTKVLSYDNESNIIGKIEGTNIKSDSTTNGNKTTSGIDSLKIFDDYSGYENIYIYDYDKSGRLKSEKNSINGKNNTILYEYDGRDNIISEKNGNTSIEYNYDDADRLLERIQKTSGSNTVNKKVDYSYDDNGNLISESLGKTKVTGNKYVSYEKKFDVNAEDKIVNSSVTSIFENSSGSLIKTKNTLEESINTEYIYNGLGLLEEKSITKNNKKSENINAIISSSVSENITEYNKKENYIYDYTSENPCVLGSYSSVNKNVSKIDSKLGLLGITYSENDSNTEKTYNIDNKYVYANDKKIASILDVSSNVKLTKNTYGGTKNNKKLKSSSSNEKSDAKAFELDIVCDERGSVTDAYDVNGKNISKIDYDSYGNISNINVKNVLADESSIDDELTIGNIIDDELNNSDILPSYTTYLYSDELKSSTNEVNKYTTWYAYERFYSTIDKRFINKDPVVSLYEKERVNSYIYAGDNPLKNIDPDGRSFICKVVNSTVFKKAMDLCEGIYDVTSFALNRAYKDVVKPLADIYNKASDIMDKIPTPVKIAAGLVGGAIAIGTGIAPAIVAGTMIKAAVSGAVISGAMYGVSSLFTGNFDKKEFVNSMLHGATDMFMISGVTLGVKGVVDCVTRNSGRIREAMLANEEGGTNAVDKLDEFYESRVRGGSNYSNLKDSKSVGAGKRFTPAQKKKIIQQNMERNGGVIKSDMSGEILVPATKSQKGVTPNPLEVQIDHIEPRSKGGTNSYSNAQVLSRYENIKKSDK